jgi:hypothetical protein
VYRLVMLLGALARLEYMVVMLGSTPAGNLVRLMYTLVMWHCTRGGRGCKLAKLGRKVAGEGHTRTQKLLRVVVRGHRMMTHMSS